MASRVLGTTATRLGLVPAQLGAYRKLMREFKPDSGVHGCCIGGDAQFHWMLRECFGQSIHIKGHPPRDQRQIDRAVLADCDELALPLDFLVRNVNLAREAHLMLAGPGGFAELLRGSGTWATIRYCLKDGETAAHRLARRYCCRAWGSPRGSPRRALGEP